MRTQCGLLRMYSGAPTGYYESHVVGWINVSEGNVGIPTVARLFCVSVETRLKIVHHKVQLLLRGSRDVNFVSLFLQSLIGIHHFQRLCGITSED